MCFIPVLSSSDYVLSQLAIIISGNDILLLNPSRGHLPMKDRAALKMPLNHVRK